MRAFAVSLVLCLVASGAVAQETVTINQMQHPALLFKSAQPGVYVTAPTVSTDIAVTVRGVVARAVVKQRFENVTARCVEAVYVFPLAEGAAVDTMRMKVGERTVDGVIQERVEAQQTYEKAKSEGKKASLLEQHRPNLFTVSVASIAAGETVEIEVEYQEVVTYDGRFSLRLPLAIGPRYTPAASASSNNAALPLPAMYQLPPDSKRNPVTLTIDLDGGVPLGTVLSPTHELDTMPLSGSHVKLTPKDVRIASDRDFELVWTPRLGTMPQRAAFSETVGNDRYTLLMLFPPDVTAKPAAVLPRETLFIIDTSGSMEGPSMEQARQALLTAIGRLRSSDRFNVIEFSSEARILFPESRVADRGTVAEALRWVSALQTTGGTEMLSALRLALDGKERNGDEIRQVVFMTDGQVENEREVFEFIRSKVGGTRLFTVGIGLAPNSHFMRNAARAGRGTFTHIGDLREVEMKMTAMLTKLESPVLANLSLDAPHGAEVWPQQLPDLYAGEPLVVTLRTPAATRSLGRIVATNWNATLDATLESTQTGIARLWARQKIEALGDRVFTGSKPDDIRKEIVEVALAHHLVTEHTSLVAVDTTPTGVDAKSCTAQLVPINLPAGWGGLDGTLPGTATNARLWMLIGALLLATALVARRLT